jgi:hypothetical protein
MTTDGDVEEEPRSHSLADSGVPQPNLPVAGGADSLAAPHLLLYSLIEA